MRQIIGKESGILCVDWLVSWLVSCYLSLYLTQPMTGSHRWLQHMLRGRAISGGRCKVTSFQDSYPRPGLHNPGPRGYILSPPHARTYLTLQDTTTNNRVTREPIAIRRIAIRIYRICGVTGGGVVVGGWGSVAPRPRPRPAQRELLKARVPGISNKKIIKIKIKIKIKQI